MSKIRVKIEVVHQSLLAVPANAVVLAKFASQSLVGTLARFDQEESGLLSRAIDYGTLGTQLGRIFTVPLENISKDDDHAKLALIVSMGWPQRLNYEDLRLLFTNITTTILDLNYRSYATLLIGSGCGGVNQSMALEALLDGVETAFVDALARPDFAPDEQFTIYLAEWERSLIPDFVGKLQTLGAAHSERIDWLDDDLPAFLTIQFSTPGNAALMTVYESEVQLTVLQQLVERCSCSKIPDEQNRLSRLLTGLLLPNNISQPLAESKGVTMIVDRRTAWIPWELADLSGRMNSSRQSTKILGLNPGMCRQFRAVSRGAAIPPPLNNELKVLLIANPDDSLPEAGAEGLAVLKALFDLMQTTGIELKVTARIGSQASTSIYYKSAMALQHLVKPGDDFDVGYCDPIEIMGLMNDTAFDVIHFVGHSGEVEGRSGWLMAQDIVLTAAELLRHRRAPRLVFANACKSGDFGSNLTERPLSSRAGLAEAFFECGVQNYIGTAWNVSDDCARIVAVKFYTRLLQQNDCGLGEALREARNEAYKGIAPEDLSWAAYQHYGAWNDRLLLSVSPSQP